MIEGRRQPDGADTVIAVARNGAKLAEQAAETRSRFRALTPEQMPRDYAISLDAYRRGGTDAFLDRAPIHAVRQPMAGFEERYVNIVDYIVRITHRIWEEKDIGYIYDTYSHDCAVWDDLGLQYGRDKVVAGTVQLNNAFPDIRIVADEVIWAGDDQVGFHTSHRTRIFGTNTGFSAWGPPTGKHVQFWCLANCVARDNEIFDEYVIYDTTALLQQMGYDPRAVAATVALAGDLPSLPANFAAGEGKRAVGQNKPATMPVPERPADDPRAFAEAVLHTIWNRRNLAMVSQVYSANVVVQATAGRVYRGIGQLQSFILSMLATFPDLALAVEDCYWMGNVAEGVLLAVRWSITGTHTGPGRYGEPTGKAVNLWGIAHWVIDHGRIQKEWFMFNEWGLLIQLQPGK